MEQMNSQGTTDSDDRSIRLLVSGQRNGMPEGQLSSSPNIQVELAGAHIGDIKVYAEAKSLMIQKKFSIDDKMRNDIIKRVCSGAKGMFLYAKVVLGNLLSQLTRGHFKRELEAENFPKGLDEAYERVVVHVLENPDQGERDAAKNILGLVICAERPLMWKEIQSHFCINIEAETADVDFWLPMPCKNLCGSLVYVEQTTSALDQVVNLVHESARLYLLQTQRFVLEAENAKLAMFCARYLGSSPFIVGTEPAITDHFLTGYYGFLDYAAANWWRHAKRLIDTLSPETSSNSDLSAAILAISKLSKSSKLSKPENSSAKEAEELQRKIQGLQHDGRDWEAVFPVEGRVHAVRNSISGVGTEWANGMNGKYSNEEESHGVDYLYVCPNLSPE
ncbi:hypothetical protein B0T24DRAFT_666498 [Lasiosphaeria ovina]|uniref:GPI inositol-deacylase winged helix domain-containing protein n=1 Tax=Lasiosphaeria ovina TaxID=92902 RepID=A0AAE0KAF4_9PEZI|nr:hypothetical protein B0T24DRAFT_666498 [Lasiosphaeria ovina]